MSKKRKQRDEFEVLKERIRSDRLFEAQGLEMRPTSGEKMSEVLFRFIEPYWGLAEGKEDYEKLLTIAMIAWNTALLPEGEREEFLNEKVKPVLSSLGRGFLQDFKAIVESLIRRKERFFSDNRRFIVDYVLSEVRGNRYHLSVASMTLKD